MLTLPGVLQALSLFLLVFQFCCWYVAVKTPNATPTAYRGLTWYEWLYVACFLFLPLTLACIAFKISTVV